MLCGVVIDICADCGGIWFDKNELGKILYAQTKRTAPAAADKQDEILAELGGEILGVSADIAMQSSLPESAAEAVIEFIGEALASILS